MSEKFVDLEALNASISFASRFSGIARIKISTNKASYMLKSPVELTPEAITNLTRNVEATLEHEKNHAMFGIRILELLLTTEYAKITGHASYKTLAGEDQILKDFETICKTIIFAGNAEDIEITIVLAGMLCRAIGYQQLYLTLLQCIHRLTAEYRRVIINYGTGIGPEELLYLEDGDEKLKALQAVWRAQPRTMQHDLIELYEEYTICKAYGMGMEQVFTFEKHREFTELIGKPPLSLKDLATSCLGKAEHLKDWLEFYSSGQLKQRRLLTRVIEQEQPYPTSFVQELIAEHALDIHADKETPLFSAIFAKNTEIAKMLVEAGCDINEALYTFMRKERRRYKLYSKVGSDIEVLKYLNEVFQLHNILRKAQVDESQFKQYYQNPVCVKAAKDGLCTTFEEIERVHKASNGNSMKVKKTATL